MFSFSYHYICIQNNFYEITSFPSYMKSIRTANCVQFSVTVQWEIFIYKGVLFHR